MRVKVREKIGAKTLHILSHVRLTDHSLIISVRCLYVHDFGLMRIGQHRYFPEDTTYAVSFAAMVSINYCNLIEIVRTIFYKIVFMGPSEGPLFLEVEHSYSPGTEL
jgi:hypothetical protein